MVTIKSFLKVYARILIKQVFFNERKNEIFYKNSDCKYEVTSKQNKYEVQYLG